MTRSMKWTLLLAAMLLLVSPALAKDAEEAVPQQAIGKDTMLAVYFDVTQIDAEMIDRLGEVILALSENEALQDQEIALPVGDPRAMVDALTLMRGAFLQAGGEGLVMTVGMPGEEGWSPPMSLLAKTNGKFDAPAMAALIRTMGDGEMEAAIEPLGNGWQNIALTSKEGDEVTLPLPEPDEAVFAAFNKQLTQHKKPVMSVAFRMQEELRLMMDFAEEAAKNAQPGQGEDAQAQMAMGMLMGMFKPVRSLDTLGIAVSQVGEEGMLVDVQMTFLDAQNAQMFANLYNSILMFAPVILSGQAQGGEVENMPDPATINQFFMKLKMQVAGDTLKLTLDQAFFDLLDQMAPLFEGVQEEVGPGLEL